MILPALLSYPVSQWLCPTKYPIEAEALYLVDTNEYVPVPLPPPQEDRDNQREERVENSLINTHLLYLDTIDSDKNIAKYEKEEAKKLSLSAYKFDSWYNKDIKVCISPFLDIKVHW